jgi:Respiratory-chain NADH dehydrogenase, 49 Kd subunit
VGEPSADGLVMEPLEFRFGPLGTPLPGGLVAEVTLDGDVVAGCEVTALLTADDGAAVPDPLTPHAWRAALAGAHEMASGVAVPPAERWIRIAGVEVERALSHMAWLRAFARLLGWPVLVERASRAVTASLEARRLSEPALGDARSELGSLAAFLDGSRSLRWRTAGRGPVPRDHAGGLGLRGPAARASGLAVDARLDDPLYGRLGFQPVVRSDGDALARTLVRAVEAVASVELAIRALEESASGGLGEALPATANPAVVEGPRGPVVAHLGHATAPGHDAALAAAGDAAVGAEWAAALVGLASFDLSPWRVAG